MPPQAGLTDYIAGDVLERWARHALIDVRDLSESTHISSAELARRLHVPADQTLLRGRTSRRAYDLAARLGPGALTVNARRHALAIAHARWRKTGVGSRPYRRVLALARSGTLALRKPECWWHANGASSAGALTGGRASRTGRHDREWTLRGEWVVSGTPTTTAARIATITPSSGSAWSTISAMPPMKASPEEQVNAMTLAAQIPHQRYGQRRICLRRSRVHMGFVHA